MICKTYSNKGYRSNNSPPKLAVRVTMTPKSETAAVQVGSHFLWRHSSVVLCKKK